MARIPVSIYRVYDREKSNILDTLKNLETLSPSNYLININDSNISYNSTPDNLLIEVSENNFPQGFIPLEVIEQGMVTKKVLVDEKGRNYLLFENQNFYLKSIGSVEQNNTELENSIKEIFTFYINPVRITPSYKKIFNEIRTRGGWEIQHWGNALDELRVECITGGMNFRDELRTQPLDKTESVMNSHAWKKIVDLRSIYVQDHHNRNKQSKTLLGINYYDSFCVGFFTDFTGPIPDAEKPYIMSFSFTFKVQSTIYTNQTRNLRERNV